MGDLTKWISIDDSLPRLEENVEVYNEDTGRKWTTRRTDDPDIITMNDGFAGLPLFNKVTHWRYVNNK